MFSKFSQNFPTICVFRPNAQKFNAWFVNSLKNMLKECIFINFLKKVYQNFRKFSQKFSANCFFRPIAQKGNAWFVKSFEN